MRANPPGTCRNESVTRGSSELGGKVFSTLKNGSSVATRPQKAAKVEYTWSISKPVMSQLITRASATHDHDEELETSAMRQQLHRPPSSKQKPSRQPEHRRNRAIRQKEASRQREKDRPSPSTESGKIEERSGASEGRKKSVADIILENMIQDEQKQKERQKKREMKQEQTTQDLNHLWERFQDVFGKKSRGTPDGSKRAVRSRPPREATPSDISPPSSSDVSSGGKRSSICGQSLEITTDSDEEFERFLHRIREIQSSESSYAEDMRSLPSRASSSDQHFTREKHEATPSDRLLGKPRHTTVDSSASVTPTATSDDEHARRNESRTPAYQRPNRKADRQNVIGPVAVPSSAANAKSMIPMWLNVKNKEMTKMGKMSTSCTCGAKARKEMPKPSGVRDIGVNCPTPPLEVQNVRLPVAADIAVLRAGSPEEDILRPAPASLVKLSLQDAFVISKQEFIERSRERIKKVNQRRDERKNEKTTDGKVIVVVPSERNRHMTAVLKPEEDRVHEMKSNKRFEQLQRKKPRPMTTREIRDVNKRVYKNLPEVRKKRDEERRAEFYKTNRLRAQLYGKHVRNTNRIFTAV
ncbi:uncharacterized protein LOC114515762 [Dendronephthya gigantea]|uniref:uncharacterized protein LOC114515762 n=1 Tax=Dendronephthya gigantea TaxID=151771 RepID=UPI00106A5DA1|nr:uncharacterized protein LOC114515762 [Dendronephthya gigantea]